MIGEVSSHFRDFVEDLARSCVAGHSCGHPWLVEPQVGEMSESSTRGLDSVASQ